MQFRSFRTPEDLVAWLRRQHRLFSTKEAAIALGKHQETIYKWIYGGRLVAVRDQDRWKIDPARLADWIEEHSGVFVAPEHKAKVVGNLATKVAAPPEGNQRHGKGERLDGSPSKDEPAVDDDRNAANGVRR